MFTLDTNINIVFGTADGLETNNKIGFESMKLRSHIEIRYCRKICYIKMVVAPLIGMLEAYVKTLPLLSAFI